MRVTVCQLPDDEPALGDAWSALVAHLREERSEWLLLPELPFHPWIAGDRGADDSAWQAAVDAHRAWRPRLTALAPVTVAITEPTTGAEGRRNQAAVLNTGRDDEPLHAKTYLPDEEGFWEASCYGRGPTTFESTEAGGATVGFLICTEMWFTEHARAYARQGVQILACPRATARPSADKWLAGGRAAAVCAGAYGLSSNRGGTDRRGMRWAGQGWIVEPEEGDVLGVTEEARPFLTREIDLGRADRAKRTYPRYVVE